MMHGGVFLVQGSKHTRNTTMTTIHTLVNTAQNNNGFATTTVQTASELIIIIEVLARYNTNRLAYDYEIVFSSARWQHVYNNVFQADVMLDAFMKG
jgi:hypothetical protein